MQIRRYSNQICDNIQLMAFNEVDRWIQGFINPGTLYLPRPDGRGKYIILGLINPVIHRIARRWNVIFTVRYVALGE